MSKIQIQPDDRTAIETLLNEVVARRDNGEGHRVAELFTEDAMIVTPHSKMEGRSAIHAYFSDAERAASTTTRHLWTNLALAPLDDGSVQVDSYAVTVVSATGAPEKGVMLMVGNTHDIAVHENGMWRLASRHVTHALRGRLAAVEGKP
jgi:uncharacterized protein (TIGR02246 family)